MKSLFLRQFVTTAVLLMVSFMLASLTFFSFGYSYILNEQHQELESNASLVSRVAGAYDVSGSLEDNLNFRMSLSAIAVAADVHIMVCDTYGTVYACSDLELHCGHMGTAVGADIAAQVMETGEYFGISGLQGVHNGKSYIIGKQMYSGGENHPMGIVIVASEVEQLQSTIRGLVMRFLMTALLTMVLAFMCITYLSNRQTKPLVEMAEAARQFGHGHFNVRVSAGRRHDEVGDLAEAFNNMAQSLERSEKQRAEFISNVSHELKTPMTTIGGFVDGILDGTIPAEKEKEYLTVVSEEVSRLSRLVRDMLDISRLEAKKDQLVKQRFDMNELIVRTLLTFEQKITEKELEVETILPEEALMVMGEPDSIYRVLYNLMDNAIKFADDGGVLSVSAVRRSKKAYITIGDSGAEISSEQQQLIFERFHKTDASRSIDKDGVGLGLYIVKSILNNHGEDITVKSEKGYTEFTFTMELE